MRMKSLLIALGLAAGLIACDDTAKTEKPTTEEPTKTEEEAKPEAKTEEAPKEVVLPMSATKPIAKVGDHEIKAELFNTEVERLAKIAPQLPANALEKFKEQTVDRLIDQHLVEKAIDAEKIEASKEEVDAELADFYKSVGGEAEAQQFFQKTGVTLEELRDDLSRAVKLKKLLRKKYNIAVTDASAKEFYEKNKAQFTKPERVKASHILFKVENGAADDVVKGQEDKAKNVLKLAKADGADFAALAKEHSEGPTAPNGGDLGFFHRKQMVPAFSEAAFSAKVNDIVGPVRTEFGFHVIKVADREAEVVTTFDEVKSDIVRNLENQDLRVSMEKLTKELRDGVQVEKFADAIVDNPKYQASPPPMMQMPMGNPAGGQPMPMPKGHPPMPSPK